MTAAPPTGPWAALPWFMAALPQRRADMLDRPRVTEVMEHAVEHFPLTVVAAPSGHGKTTAVAAWARDRSDVVWVSASAATDSSTIVRGCLLEALPPVERARLVTLGFDDPAPNPLELIAAMTVPRILVIDDAHLLEPEAVLQTIAADAVLATGMLRVVLVGQLALGRDFSRELVSGLATSVTSRDLVFSLPEVHELLRLDGDEPVPGRAEDMLRRSLGWPVGLHLLRLGGGHDAEVASVCDDAWPPEAFDFVEHKVLGQLSPQLQTFVLEAATCGRTTVRLVSLLTGRTDSAELLADCLRDGLFLERFTEPGEEDRYRWHDTFVGFARSIRMRRDPDRCRELHRTAALAMARDCPGAAVEQALLAEDPELAADIIGSNWLALLLTSQADTLDQLCLALPSTLQESADILLIRACCCDILGQRTDAEQLRHRAATAPVNGTSEFVRRFTNLYLASDPQEKALAADLAHDALAEVAETRDFAHAVFLLGWVELRLRRDPERAVQALTSAVRVARAHGLGDLAVRAQANLAFALTYAGHFDAADAALTTLEPDHVEQEDWDCFDDGLALFAHGYRHFHRGELAKAFDCFERMVKGGGSDCSFLGLARVYFALSASALGRSAVYNEAEYHLSLVSNRDRHGVPWESYKRLGAARLLEARGKLDIALEVAEPLLNRNGLPVTHSQLAEFYRRAGEPTLSHIALSRIERQSRPRYAHVSALVTTAALNAEQGHHEDAHRFLERAICVAAPESAWFPFLARDAAVTQLLESHARSGRDQESLAEIFELRGGVHPGPEVSLTAREHEILAYLRTSLTTLEIARELHLSPNTVKTHLRAIYRKLGVPNRRSAVRLIS